MHNCYNSVQKLIDWYVLSWYLAHNILMHDMLICVSGGCGGVWGGGGGGGCGGTMLKLNVNVLCSTIYVLLLCHYQ